MSPCALISLGERQASDDVAPATYVVEGGWKGFFFLGSIFFQLVTQQTEYICILAFPGCQVVKYRSRCRCFAVFYLSSDFMCLIICYMSQSL